MGADAFAGELPAGGGTTTNATAIGSNSFAVNENAIAIGNHLDDPTVPAGAFGANSIAIGTDAQAGTEATLADPVNGQPGEDAIAIGSRAVATNDGSIAIGAGATSSGQNSTAIGDGAVATQDNQMALGSSATNYTLAGLANVAGAAMGDQLLSFDPTTGNLTGSPISVTATGIAVDGTLSTNGDVTVNGDISATTVDADDVNATTVDADTVTATTVAATDVNTTNVTATGTVQGATVQGDTLRTTTGGVSATDNQLTVTGTTTTQALSVGTGGMTVASGANVDMGGNVVHGVGDPIGDFDAANKRYVDAGLNRAFEKIDENTEGIALAIAMGGIALPQGKDFAVAANMGFYDGKQAVSAQTAIRLDETFSVNGGLGVGLDNNKVGGRVGVMAAW